MRTGGERGFDGPGAAYERDRAWGSAFAAALLTCLGEVAFAGMEHFALSISALLEMRLCHIALCLGVAGALVAWKQAFNLKRSGRAFLAVVLPCVPVFWIAEVHLAGRREGWIPFVGFKLLMMGIALLAPPMVRVGFALMGVLLLETVLLWFDFDARARQLATGWEPWMTFLYTAIAAGLLAYRARTLKRERRFFQARAEAESLERLARLFLAVRDQANTPLQSIEIVSTMLEDRFPEAAEDVARIHRAVKRLRELTRMLSGFEGLMTWARDDESIDAHALLERLQGTLDDEVRRRPSLPSL